MSLDLSIGRGDNAPVLTWAMPFAVAGSDFDLVITSPAAVPGQPSIVLTLTVSGGDLVLDPVANTVSWPVTTVQSEALSYSNLYTLRRVVTGGEIRYYASGRIFGVDGPVGPSSAVVQVAGPQGPLPSNAQIIVAVKSVVGQPGGIAGQDAFVAEVERAEAAENANAGAITAEAVRAEAAEAALSQAQTAAAPKSFSVAIASRGQTIVPMPSPPSVLSSVRLVVNASEYAAPTIAANATALTWLNPDFVLEPSDTVLLSYV